MTFTPQLLGIFTDIYGSYDAMDIPKALLVALVGFLTVLIILAVIALFIKLIAFVFSIIDKKNASKATAITESSSPAAAPEVQGTPLPETMSQGELKLTDVDEQTAAVVMALVSHQSGIPLNKLAFKSIKLLEDK